MQKVCLVIAGQWRCGAEGDWDFVLDKGKLGRMVSINETCTLEELSARVVLAFQEENMKPSFSFCNNSCWGSAAGLKMPPYMIESDIGVRNYFQILMERSDSVLLVSFTLVEEDIMFQTPVRVRNVDKEAVLGSGSCSNVPVLEEDIIDDENGLIEEVEAVEEQMRSNGKSKMVQGDGSNCNRKRKLIEPNWDLLDEDDMSDDNEVDVAEEDVKFGGYDTEFWEPLVDDVYGGSNAVEVMCTTNDAFDHVVISGSNASKGKFEKMEAGVGATNSCFDGQNNGGTNSDYRFRDEGNINSHFEEHRSGNRNSMFPGHTSDAPNSGFDGNIPSNIGGRQGLKRKLSDYLDEEFDVDPLFDDTTYEWAEIPDLDIDVNDNGIYVGKTFGSKLDCQIYLAIYAIKNMFYFKQTRSRRNYIVVDCADISCDWRVTAYEMKDSCYYQIRKAILEHTCSIETRSQYTKLVSSKVIAALYRSKFSDKESGPSPMDLQQLLLEDLRVSSSYTKCWKAREAANIENQGSEEDSYLNLLPYLHMLKTSNPGTIADVETVDDGDGGERFLYLFLAFGASIAGFRFVRPVIVIDGTHLCGKYKGVLLTASGQDGNFQIFPLAFAVVDIENEAAWTWFLAKVERIIADHPRVTIISDRANSIIKAVKAVYKRANHGACIVHLSRNVVSKFKSKGLAKMVTKAACAYRLGEFKDAFGDIMSKNVECWKYLEKCGRETWSRVYFPGDRYTLMTSNIAESLNNALRRGRKSPLIELIMFIQSLMTRWFAARMKKSLSHTGFVTPQVDKVITMNLNHGKGSRVTCINPWCYEVTGLFGERITVDIKGKKCSCKVYDKLKIPCGHALIASSVKGVPYGQLCADYYKTTVWQRTYEGEVKPHEDPKDGDIPECIRVRVLGPPKTKRPAGRPKQKRIPSIGEISKGSSQRGSSNRCGRCKGVGHNRTSCTTPI